MEKELRILMIEDVRGDAVLIENELRKIDCSFVLKRIQTKAEFLHELKQFEPNLIFSDYSLPTFDGLTALMLTKELAPQTPFILITGTLNEETAVECMKAGVADYVLKDHLQRLVPAVIGALDRRRVQAAKEHAEEARRQAEATIRENERRWRTMLENIQFVVVHLNLQGNVEYLNPFFYSLTGYQPEEVIGKHWFEDFLPVRDRRNLRAVFAEHLEKEFHLHYQGPIVSKTGEERIIAWNNTLLRDSEGRITGRLSIGEDISSRKRLEEELRQAQKMEAIGRMAGGIAHDFNNLLTAITGYCGLLLEEMGDQDPRRADVLEIKQAGDRACGLTRQLLAFSRKQVLQPKVLDLNSLVTDLSAMLRRLIGEDIELRMVLEPGIAHVKADPGQLEQVIMNLFVNARDAMPTGGQLTIETANVELNENYIRMRVGVQPGRYVRLAVSDSGCGMDKETQAHLFEPFFTTKPPGKGTGLGLSTAYGIIKQSGGDIQVYSELGLGTTFKIYLPQVDESIKPSRAERAAPTTPSGSETILLVEDDEGVRALLFRLLQANGYTVVEARRASDAIWLAERHRNPIDILVTDLVMPQMNGRELAEHLIQTHPGLKVLYMSGYTDDTVIRKGILDENLPFLQKPFAAEAFLCKLRELLDAGA